MRKSKTLLLLTMLCCMWSTALLAQNRVPITGTVRDSVGNALPGISVTIKGIKGGTTTDALGGFKINAPSSAILVFSGVGFLTHEVAITGGTVIVSLHTDPKNLSEVVVTGFGVKKDI
ncbi:MAG TPA: carboxypeptidase-like regulatory domain-containing protein, partial [Puia sp.]